MSDRVLLVGINSYQGCPLSGCLNDCHNIKAFLMKEYGFKEESFCMLLERSATTENIIKGLNWLAETAPGARAYFHYSGHGAQVPNRTDEPDGLSEVICPIDFDWTPAKMVTDKQFVQIFSKMHKGVKFNWCSDSCHSGDLDREMTRNPHIVIPRAMPHPPHIAAKVAELKKKNVHTRSLTNGIMDVGFISGCQSAQTSADTYIDGKSCGAFTYFLLKSWGAMKAAPVVAVAAATGTDLKNNGYTQIPVASGTRSSVAFFN